MDFVNGYKHYMQSHAFATYMEHLGWHAEVIGKGKEKVFAYTKTLPVLGTVVKVPKACFPVPFAALEELVAKKHPFFIRVEPNIVTKNDAEDKMVYDVVSPYGFGKTWNSGELSTIQVDLTKSEDKLFASIARENTRRNIRAAQRNKLIVKTSKDIEAFCSAHNATGKQKHFWTPGLKELTAFWQAFGRQATILTISSSKKQLLAAVMLVQYEGVCYYRYVVATDEGYALRAPSLLVWESFLLAKKAGCHSFDFYGVFDDRNPSNSWQGFSHFKRGFSSNIVRFALPVAKYYPPFGPLVRFADRVM